MKRIMALIFTLLIFIGGVCNNSFAYKVKKSHPEITNKAFDVSGMESFLNDELDIDVDTEKYDDPLGKLPPQTLVDWLEAGSEFECPRPEFQGTVGSLPESCG